MAVRNQAVSSIIDPKSWNIKAKRRVRNCERRLQRTEGRVQLTFTEKLVKRLRNGQTQEKPTWTRKGILKRTLNAELNIVGNQKQTRVWKWQKDQVRQVWRKNQRKRPLTLNFEIRNRQEKHHHKNLQRKVKKVVRVHDRIQQVLRKGKKPCQFLQKNVGKQRHDCRKQPWTKERKRPVERTRSSTWKVTLKKEILNKKSQRRRWRKPNYQTLTNSRVHEPNQRTWRILEKR